MHESLLHLSLSYLPSIPDILRLRTVSRATKAKVTELLEPLLNRDIPTLVELLFVMRIQEMHDAQLQQRPEVLPFPVQLVDFPEPVDPRFDSPIFESKEFLRQLGLHLDPRELIHRNTLRRTLRRQYSKQLSRLRHCTSKNLDELVPVEEGKTPPRWKLSKVLSILASLTHFGTAVAGLSVAGGGRVFGSSRGTASLYIQRAEIQTFCSLSDPSEVKLVDPETEIEHPLYIESFREERGRLFASVKDCRHQNPQPVEVLFAPLDGNWVAMELWDGRYSQLPLDFSMMLRKC
jgi:hypothetical protein